MTREPIDPTMFSSKIEFNYPGIIEPFAPNIDEHVLCDIDKSIKEHERVARQLVTSPTRPGPRPKTGAGPSGAECTGRSQLP